MPYLINYSRRNMRVKQVNLRSLNLNLKNGY